MTSSLEKLPPELLNRIISYLLHGDLPSLMQCNQLLHRGVFPLVWTSVELHRPGYHEDHRYEEEFEHDLQLLSDRQRNYHSDPEYDNLDRTPDAAVHYIREDQKYVERAFTFLQVFANIIEKPSFQRLTQRILSLCMTFEASFDEASIPTCWSILACFGNLHRLELTVCWPYVTDRWDESRREFLSQEHSALTKLMTLHLRGYIPREVIQYLCEGSASTIEDLELGVLDRPVESTLCNQRGMIPPAMTEDRALAEADSSDSQVHLADTADDNSSTASELSTFAEEIAPRALTAFQETSLPSRFAALQRLTLLRPAEAAFTYDDFHEIYISIPSDTAVLMEWSALIRATSQTLRHLTLDQRPFAEKSEEDTTNDSEFLIDYPYGPGYDRSVHHVLPTLLDTDLRFPRLQAIDLYGFDVPDKYKEDYTSEDGNDQVDRETLKARLESRFISLGVEIRSGLGRRMIYDRDDGVVRRGDGLGGSNLDKNEWGRG